ncbi:MAG: hypothetical protein HQL46_15460, partial [Gammaproteobacteria bacterium]|nr:hypothetical protein [Gammaproteobacteria bacterium]
MKEFFETITFIIAIGTLLIILFIAVLISLYHIYARWDTWGPYFLTFLIILTLFYEAIYDHVIGTLWFDNISKKVFYYVNFFGGLFFIANWNTWGPYFLTFLIILTIFNEAIYDHVIGELFDNISKKVFYYVNFFGGLFVIAN